MEDVEVESITRYMEVLYNEALLLTTDGYDAEDVVQMCFEWVIKNRRTITYDMLLKICRYASGEFSKYRHNREKMFADAVMVQLDPLDVYLHKEAAKRIIECVDLVRYTYRKVLRLNIADGLTPAEIARVLGMKPNTVRKKIIRGKILLREVLVKKGLL